MLGAHATRATESHDYWRTSVVLSSTSAALLMVFTIKARPSMTIKTNRDLLTFFRYISFKIEHLKASCGIQNSRK